MSYNLHEQLLQDIKDEKEGAFEQLFKEYWSRIYYYAYKYFGNIYDAEDITQEVFVILNRRLKTLENYKYLTKNIMWVTMEVCHKHKGEKNVRIEKNFIDIEDVQDEIIEENKEFLPDEVIQRKELHSQIIEIVNKLPDKQREVIILYYFNEFSQPEIAQITNSKIQAVQNRLFNAKKTLREQVDILIEKGGVKVMAVTPILTQLFQSEMKVISTNEIQEVIWQNTMNKINQNIFNNQEHNLDLSQNSPLKFKFYISSLVATACICTAIAVININSQNEKENALSQNIASEKLRIEDMIKELKKVKSQTEFESFAEKYNFNISKNVQSENENFYTVYLQDKNTINDDKGHRVLAGYCIINGEFKIAYEIQNENNVLPNNVKEWIEKNIKYRN